MGTAVASLVKPWLSNATVTSPFGRYAMAALLGRSGTDPIQAETGVLPGSSVSPLAMTSTATNPPTVSVSPGYCVVQASAGGTYVCTLPVATSVTLTAAAGQPRIDVLCARVRDTEADSSGVTAFELLSVDGTPASSPSAPAVPAGYLPLWNIQVATNGSQTFTDRRIFTRSAGGIRYCPSYDTARAGGYVGDVRVQSSGQIDVWLGAAWTSVASPSIWAQFSPTLVYAGGGSISPGTVGLGSGGSGSGRYMQIGKRFDLSYLFRWNGNGSGGAGAVSTQMPPGFVSRLSLETHMHAHLYVNDSQSGWAINFIGDAYIPPNSSIINLEMPASRNDCSTGAYTISSAGSAGTGTPNIPGGFPVGGVLTFSGVLEIQ